jgi:hypothetical protein
MNETEDNKAKNSLRLHQLIEEASLTQQKALELFNHGQVRPLSISAWKKYLLAKNPNALGSLEFSDALLAHAEKVLKE